MRHLITYAATFAIFAVLDLIWLGLVAKDLYRSQLSGLMAERLNLPAAAAFYLLYALGLSLFVVAPALQSGTWKAACLWGALFGLVAYATYDLTNLATLRGWPVALSLIDMLWGAAVSAATSMLAVLLLRNA